MATIKSYTDIEQSKKLAEILPLESADMGYDGIEDRDSRIIRYTRIATTMPNMNSIPCWSLAALLNLLESEIYGEEGELYQLNINKDGTWWDIEYIERYYEAKPIEIKSTEELIDACYEMILKLNEQKLL